MSEDESPKKVHALYQIEQELIQLVAETHAVVPGEAPARSQVVAHAIDLFRKLNLVAYAQVRADLARIEEKLDTLLKQD